MRTSKRPPRATTCDRTRGLHRRRPAAARRQHPRPGRAPRPAARRREHAGVHAGRDQRHGEGPPPGRPARGGRRDRPRQHLPPLPAARPRADRAPRRPPLLHGAGTARSSRTPAGSRWSRSATSAPSTTAGSPSAATWTAPSTGSRPSRPWRSRRRSGRTSPSRSTSPSRRRARTRRTLRRRHGADAPLGRPLRRGAAPARPGALRGHPGRPGPRAARRVHPGDRLAPVRRPEHRRPRRRRDARAAQRRAGHRRPLLADDPRPRYLMGLGSPLDLVDAVDRGVDMFDSVLPARVARNGQLWVPGGRLNLRNAEMLDDPRPVQEDCPCLLCRGFSRAYLAHLFRAQGAPRVPARDLSQPDLHPRVHGEDPALDRGRDLPRRHARTACSRPADGPPCIRSEVGVKADEARWR